MKIIVIRYCLSQEDILVGLKDYKTIKIDEMSEELSQ